MQIVVKLTCVYVKEKIYEGFRDGLCCSKVYCLLLLHSWANLYEFIVHVCIMEKFCEAFRDRVMLFQGLP